MSATIEGLGCAIATMCLAGCTVNPPFSDYMETAKSGVKALPHVQEIAAVFTHCPKSHYIEQLGLRAGSQRKPAKWNTVVWFGGRYELCYQVNVLPDYRAHKVKIVNPGRFYLLEVAEITEHGRGAKFNPAGNKEFGEGEWEKVVAAKGDFSIIGVTLRTNSPVAGFDTYVNACQEDSWSVKETVSTAYHNQTGSTGKTGSTMGGEPNNFGQATPVFAILFAVSQVPGAPDENR